MDETIRERALDVLMHMIEFYHEKLIWAECEGLTGIQQAQFRLMFQLCHTPMLPMSVLGKKLFISKPYMTALVDSLVQEGLVERHYNPDDRRVINITISQSGQKRLESVQNRIREKMRILLANLPDSDMQALCSSGETVVKIVSKIE
ncbi:MAG: MarR family transcriptional regulator [Methanospirillaceae archaeon]|nr:MarR family transcriptional regulator [Methanospirillaceae archaeon]